MNIIKYLSNLNIQSLGRVSTGLMMMVVLIGISINIIFSQKVNMVNEEWLEQSESINHKTSYLLFMRQALGYGGMIHHFKNYVLRGDLDDLVEANFHILELRTFISAYQVAGASELETKSLIVIEDTIEKYFNALKRAERLKNGGFSVAQVDQQIIVDDAPAFQALLVLDRVIYEERAKSQAVISGNMENMARLSLVLSIIEIAIVLILFLLFVWIYRSRIVALYAREVSDKKKIDEERIKIDTMVNSIREGLVTIDSVGTILTINDAVIEIYGYDRDKLIGENVKILVPAPHYAKHDEYIKNYLDTGQAKIIGLSRELESVRANGELFPIDLNISEMDVGGERHFVGIIRDISDRKAADRAKKQFIATVSHELRTPLTAIQGALGMVTTGVLGDVPDKIEGLIGVAMNNTRRLISLVNDLLDLEKLDAGQMSFDYSEQALAEIIGNAYYSNLPYADKYEVKLNLTGKGRGLNVWADPKRLEQVLTNLLSNAIKFSPKNETVTINFFKKGDVARVEVIDKGAGIPEKFKEIIFKRFSQADTSDSRAKGGTGLGLSISKVIVENHGGNIGFESKAGEGSLFYFELPVFEKQEPETVFINPDYINRQILIVEDTNSQADMLSKRMREFGFNPSVVRNIAQARNLMHSSPIDTLIVDLDHAGLGKSLDLVENIRMTKSITKFPIIFIARDVERLQSEASSSRFDVNLWLKRPFTVGYFLSKLDGIIQSLTNPKQKILLIDGDAGFSIKVKKHLEATASVTIATTLAEAKLCYEHISFDIFIIDPETAEGDLKAFKKDLDKKSKEDDFATIYYSMDKLPKPNIQSNLYCYSKTNHSFDEFLTSVNEVLSKL